MGLILRYRVSYLKMTSDGHYQSGSKEFRSLRHLIEFANDMIKQGGTIRSVDKWALTAWTSEETAMIASLGHGKINL